MSLTEADLYEYRQMVAGKYGPHYTAIRKLVGEVQRLKRDLLATKPAGVIRNEEVDSVVRASLEMHRSITSLIVKLRPIPVDELEGREQVIPAASVPAKPIEQPTVPPDRLAFGVADVGKLLGVSRTLVNELVLSGRLESVRIGRRRLVTREAIDRFLKGVGTIRV